ncbi:hypothetical protein BDR06DRAFT_960598 [Suillus hirtellus]|nr:hypothetical protein BDR06DRAFT_960598 [Suillus hirtellus]
MVPNSRDHFYCGYNIVYPDFGAALTSHRHLATHCNMVLSCASNLHVVAVPLRDGAETATDTSQVQVTHWVDHLKPDLFVSPTERIRKMYNLITDVPVPALGYAFFRKYLLVHKCFNFRDCRDHVERRRYR